MQDQFKNKTPEDNSAKDKLAAPPYLQTSAGSLSFAEDPRGILQGFGMLPNIILDFS